MSETNKYCIIVAGGSGSRMGMDIPKQFLLLGNKPVLFHSIESFHEYDREMQIVLVLPAAHIKTWKELISKYPLSHEPILVEGGKTRYHSVKNGLNLLPDNGLVAIHDGARPFIGKELISSCFNAAAKKGNTIPVIPVEDSMRIIEGDKNSAVDRNNYVRIQTPQLAEVKLLKKAFEQKWQPAFTDESNMLEAMGVEVHLVEGDPGNIKITNKADLELAEFLFKKGS